ncbi:MAG: ArdC-like ssDNA-binding domain-containing protein [Alphaproteobacteria bacterium]|nr:ArdC-like ssDNA-binding domain-containing protein [Alphaproteobacteria bacterium]
MGAHVREGEKGVQVVFWKSVEIESDGEDQEAETRMFARYSVVFNADQVDGYDTHSDFIPSDIDALRRRRPLIFFLFLSRERRHKPSLPISLIGGVFYRER